jgi:hypothetical protein
MSYAEYLVHVLVIGYSLIVDWLISIFDKIRSQNLNKVRHTDPEISGVSPERKDSIFKKNKIKTSTLPVMLNLFQYLLSVRIQYSKRTKSKHQPFPSC